MNIGIGIYLVFSVRNSTKGGDEQKAWRERTAGVFHGGIAAR